MPWWEVPWWKRLKKEEKLPKGSVAVPIPAIQSGQAMHSYSNFMIASGCVSLAAVSGFFNPDWLRS